MEMNNFNSVFDELSKLYEEATKAAQKDTKLEEAVKESCSKKVIKEAAEDDVAEVEADADEAIVEEAAEEDQVEEIDEEPKQLALECSKCGALVIKAEKDVVIDEESDLANVEDACEYCEESEGYKIVGVVIPYITAEEEEPVEEPAEEIEDEPVFDEDLKVETDSEEELEEILDFNVPISANLNVKADGNTVPVLSTTK